MSGSGSGGHYGSRRFRGTRTSSRGSGRAVPIPLEPLKEGHKMDPHERLFLEAAERGDKHTMIRCLQGPGPVNVNCTNILGRSAIQIAVDNENVEIVELLLKQDGVKIGDALLYAIREGVYRIVEMLIDHPSITREMLGSEWAHFKQADEESSDYSPDISPIILAAHCNQFEILQLLLSRGAKIERPHALTCSCSKCRREMQEDSLRHSLLRIHTYRALSSPAWISLTSPDPVLSAFKLSWELEHLAMRENEFKDIYAELSDKCKKYSCDLLEQCRSSEEVIAVLNKDMDSDCEEDNDIIDTENLTLARFKLALKYEQKQFVAHPHCQQLLASIWYAGLPGWRKHNIVSKVIIIVVLICLLPVMALIYLFLPRSRVGQLLRTPFMKFMYHSASFVVFLFLLITASTNMGAGTGEDVHRLRQNQRGPLPSPLEWLILFYVMGFIWAECKQLWDEGLKAYVRQWWNWLDFIMLSLYLCTFSLRLVAFAQSLYPDSYGKQFMPRTMWPEGDPTLVSEGVFAIANVFSFARIIYLFQANPQLGPLQISLGCMLIDIGKFLFIFFLVITSFACGLNQLYYFYSNTDNVTVGVTTSLDGNQTVYMQETANDFENAFDPIMNSYITLFWSLFGLTQLKTVREGHMQRFTKSVGEYLLMVYHAMSVIVLINMLIAMMSNSFQEIEDHADREWKFARSKLWMGYFDEGSTLPPPFNLIISPKSVYYVLRYCKNVVVSCFRRKRRPPPSHHKDVDGTLKTGSEIVGYTNNHIAHSSSDNMPDPDTVIPNEQAQSAPAPEPPTYNGNGQELAPIPEKRRYLDVMRRLVSRYIHQWKKQMRQDGVNEDDLLEIKQDISSLRYELREDRKRESARTAGHIDNLKREILRSIRHSNSLGVAGGGGGGGGGSTGGSLSRDSTIDRDPPSPTVPYSTSGTFITGGEVELLKRDIIASVRTEIRELAREMVVVGQAPRGTSPLTLPPGGLGSDLYQTHLYTQL